MKKKYILPIVVVIVVLSGITIYANIQSSKNIPQIEQKDTRIEAINGIKVEAAEVKRPFAVVVENHLDSRPQSGLSSADLVYEALAEGGITRFLAIYQTGQAEMIGPVRSARTYFNDWAQELSAIYAHVGGNSDALYYLQQGIPGVTDIDEFYNEKYFWRTSRPRPHNTYTSTAKLEKLVVDKKLNAQASYIPWIFKDDQPEVEPSVVSIPIEFSKPQFAVKWTYDKETNSYKRSMAGQPHVDVFNNQRINAKNIIVQIVANWPVESDTILAISMGTRSGGNAYFFLDGKKVTGSWKYEQGRTKFYDSFGSEMKFNRGQTWVEIVPPEFESIVK